MKQYCWILGGGVSAVLATAWGCSAEGNPQPIRTTLQAEILDSSLGGYAFPVWIYPYGSESPLTAIPCKELPEDELSDFSVRYERDLGNDTRTLLQPGGFHCALNNQGECVQKLEVGGNLYGLDRYHAHYRRTLITPASTDDPKRGEAYGSRCETNVERYLSLDGAISARVWINSSVLTSTGVYTIGLFGAESSKSHETDLMVANLQRDLRRNNTPEDDGFQVITMGSPGTGERKPLRLFTGRWVVLEIRKEGNTCNGFFTFDDDDNYEFDPNEIEWDPNGKYTDSDSVYYAGYSDSNYQTFRDNFVAEKHYRWYKDTNCELAPANTYWEDLDGKCSDDTQNSEISAPGTKLVVMARARKYVSAFAPNQATVEKDDESYMMIDWVKWKGLDPIPGDLYQTAPDVDCEEVDLNNDVCCSSSEASACATNDSSCNECMAERCL